MSKELSLLRKKLDQEQQSYRDAVKAWEASQSQLRTQVEELRASEAIAETRCDLKLTFVLVQAFIADF